MAYLKAFHDSLLRFGFMALWMFAFVTTFYEFLGVTTADNGSPEQNLHAVHASVALGIGIVAAFGHAYLVHQAKKNEQP